MTATVRPATMSDLMSSEVSSRITPTMGNTSSRDLGMLAATMALMELGSSILSTGRGGAGASPLERSSPMATTVGGCLGGTRRERRARGGERRASGNEAESREAVRGPWASSVDDARGRAKGLHARCVVTRHHRKASGRRHQHDTTMTNNNRRHGIISRLVSIRFVIMTNRTRVVWFLRFPRKKISSSHITAGTEERIVDARPPHHPRVWARTGLNEQLFLPPSPPTSAPLLALPSPALVPLNLHARLSDPRVPLSSLWSAAAVSYSPPARAG